MIRESEERNRERGEHAEHRSGESPQEGATETCGLQQQTPLTTR